MPDGEREEPDVIKTLGQLIGLAAGVVALIYAAGGGVLALRLYLAHLPSRTIVAQLPRDLLISVGLAQIVLPVVAIAALYVIWRVLRGTTPLPTRLVGQWQRRSRRDWAELIGASAVPAALAAAVVGLGSHGGRGGWKGIAWLVPVAFFVILLVVLLGLNLRARLVERHGGTTSAWNSRRAVTSMTLVVALMALPICVLIAGSYFTLLDAKVCTTSGSATTGVLIGETSDRTYIGQEERPIGPLLVFSIPRDEIAETFIGGDAGLRPCPASSPSGG
jgi:hypothetical protein